MTNPRSDRTRTPSLDALLRKLAAGAPADRVDAASAVGDRIGTEDAEARERIVAALESNLTHSEPIVREMSLDAIAVAGPTARSAEASVLACLADPSAAVRSKAALALGMQRTGGPTVVAGLMRALADPDASVRGYAAVALGDLLDPEIHESEVAQLETVACDEGEDPVIRSWMRDAVARIRERGVR